MTWTHAATCIVGTVLLIAAVGWDIYVALDDVPGNTFSEIVARIAHTHPTVIYIIQVLPGHFFLNREESLVNKLGGGGAAEVYTVLLIGWFLFITFRSFSSLVPLTNGQIVALMVFSTLVGSYLWSIPPQ